MLARKTTPPHAAYDPVRLDRRAQANDLEHEAIRMYMAAAQASDAPESARYERAANAVADLVRELREEAFEDEFPTRPSCELPVALTRPVEPIELEWEEDS